MRRGEGGNVARGLFGEICEVGRDPNGIGGAAVMADGGQGGETCGGQQYDCDREFFVAEDAGLCRHCVSE